MSTFMGFAVVDLEPGTDPQALFDGLAAAVREPPLSKRVSPVAVWLAEHAGAPRVGLYSHWGNAWLAKALAAAADAGRVHRMIIGLDHDEYGAEHLILARTPDGLRRLQHVYMYPEGDPDSEGEPSLLDVPAADGAEVHDDGTVDGPVAWDAVADAYAIPIDRIAATGPYAAVAHEELGVVFTPFAPWWRAVRTEYPIGDTPPSHELFT